MGRRADNIWADRKWMANQTWADIRKHVSKPLWPLPVPRASPADPLFLKQTVLPILLPLPSFCPPMESAAMVRSPASLSPAPLLPVPARIAVRPRHAHALSFRAARPLVARCAAAGDRVEAQTPIEKCFPAFPSVMDINQIRDILPHRYPFLLVDRVVDYKPGEYAVAIKNVSINDEFFQGHFPGRPIMPGVLMVEALAQVGGIVMLQPEVGGSREKFFFAGIDKVRFRKPVVPGDTLIMRMALIKLRSGIAKMRGKAYVGFDLVCEGEFLMATGSH